MTTDASFTFFYFSTDEISRTQFGGPFSYGIQTFDTANVSSYR